MYYFVQVGQNITRNVEYGVSFVTFYFYLKIDLFGKRHLLRIFKQGKSRSCISKVGLVFFP